MPQMQALDLDFGIEDDNGDDRSVMDSANGDGHEDSQMGSSGVGNDAASSAPSTTIQRAEPPPMSVLQGKICIGCGCSAATPSPLCQGSTRMWDHSDFSSQWCRHCANVGRLRFLGVGGSIVSLAHLAQWVAQSGANARFFKMRTLAYFSLKLESTTARCNGHLLEARASLLESLIGWSRFGHTIGLPSVSIFQPMCFHEFEAYSRIFGNPFLANGLLVEANLHGQRCLGVLSPQRPDAAERQGLTVVLPGAEAPSEQNLRMLLGGGDLRVQSATAAESVQNFAREYLDVAAARQNEPDLSGVPELGSGGPSPSPTKRACVAESAIVPFQGGGSLAIAGPGQSQNNLKRSVATLNFDECGDEAPGAVPAATAAGSERSGPKTKKRKKINELETEVANKLLVLSNAEWASQSCDKSCEGLLTRVTNARSKALESCQLEESSLLEGLKGSLQLLIDFGMAHKRGWQKQGRPETLQSMVTPLANLLESKSFDRTKFHWTLKLLMVKVQFQRLLTENDFAAALRVLDIRTIADIYADGLDPSTEQFIEANAFVVAECERMVIEQIKKLKGARDFGPSLGPFLCFLEKSMGAYPELAIIPSDFTFPERGRCENFALQLDAINTLARSADDKNPNSERKPWPSEVRAAKAAMLVQPLTRIGAALDSFAGAKYMMTKVAAILTATDADELCILAVRDYCKNPFVNAEDFKNLAFDDFMKLGGKIESGLTILSDSVSKLSRLAYEQVQEDLLRFAEKLLNWCAAGFEKIFSKAVETLDPALKAIWAEVDKHGAEHFQAFHMEPLAVVKDLARAQKVVDMGWPGWVRIMTGGILRAKNFLLRVVYKVAGDQFAVYQPTLQRIIDVEAEQQPKITNAALFFGAIGSVTDLCMSDERSLPFEQAMARYRNPKHPEKLGLVSLLAQLGEKRKAIAQTSQTDLPPMEQIRVFVNTHPLLEFLGVGFVQEQVKAALGRIDALVDLAVFAISNPEAWDYDPDGTTLPDLKFLLRFDGEDIGKFSDAALSQLFGGSPGLSLGKIEATSMLDLVSLLKDVFTLQQLPTDLVKNSKEADTEVMWMYLAMVRHGVNLQHLVCAAHRLLSKCTSSASGPEDLLEKPHGEKQAGQLERRPNDQLMAIMGALHTELRDAGTTMNDQSYSAKGLDALETNMSVVTMKSWLQNAALYQRGLSAHIIKRLTMLAESDAQDLRSRCPQWQAWCKDDSYDEEKLKEFVGLLPVAKVKECIRSTHEGLTMVRKASFALGFESGLDSQSLSFLKGRINDINSALSVGMETVALRSAGVVLAATREEAKQKGVALLANLKDVSLPSSIMKAVKLGSQGTE